MDEKIAIRDCAGTDQVGIGRKTLPHSRIRCLHSMDQWGTGIRRRREGHERRGQGGPRAATAPPTTRRPDPPRRPRARNSSDDNATAWPCGVDGAALRSRPCVMSSPRQRRAAVSAGQRTARSAPSVPLRPTTTTAEASRCGSAALDGLLLSDNRFRAPLVRMSHRGRADPGRPSR
jgi:hypothetical protein